MPSKASEALDSLGVHMDKRTWADAELGKELILEEERKLPIAERGLKMEEYSTGSGILFPALELESGKVFSSGKGTCANVGSSTRQKKQV